MDIVPLLTVISVLLLVLILAVAIAITRSTGSVVPAVVSTAVIAIVVLMVAIPMINDSASNLSHKDYSKLSYDDYIKDSDVESVTGCLEIVTIDGDQYVHANDVGPASITFNDGYSVDTYVKKATLHVFMFAGQSNAAYWAGVDPSVESPTPYLGSSYYYGTDSAQSNKNLGEVTYSFHAMTDPATGQSILGGIDAPFAATLYNDLGWKTYIINCAVGGSSIVSWLPDGDNYEYAAALFDDAWSSIDTAYFDPVIESYLWIQGESNATMSVSLYETDFLAMHEALIDGSFSAHGAFKSALISKVREQNALNPSIAQLLLAKEYPTIFCGSELADTFSVANGLLLSDGLHYSQLGRNMLGIALGDYYSANMAKE